MKCAVRYARRDGGPNLASNNVVNVRVIYALLFSGALPIHARENDIFI
jgi:hypothetical protein